MTGYRLGYLTTAAGLLVGALLGACIPGTASSYSVGSWNGRTFEVQADSLQDKVLTGDSVLTFTDVSKDKCARRCLNELLCAFFFYHAAQQTCAVPTSMSRAGTVLQDAPGYRLFAVNPGSAVAPSPSEMRLCPAGALTGTRGCWKSSIGYLSHVSVGPAGAWGRSAATEPYHNLQTYGNPGKEGWWQHYSGLNYVQMDVGTDIVWVVTSSSALEYRSNITSAANGGDGWVVAYAAGYRWVSVSPQGATWAVATNGTLRYGLTTNGGFSGTVPGTVGLRSVDAGAAGVWALDDAGRLLHRLGTYGQEGVAGTGWRQVGSGVFRSVSSGRDMVVAVDSAGDVWLSSASDPSDAPTGLGWVWLGGGLAQAEIYQVGDVTVMWANDDDLRAVFFCIL